MLHASSLVCAVSQMSRSLTNQVVLHGSSGGPVCFYMRQLASLAARCVCVPLCCLVGASARYWVLPTAGCSTLVSVVGVTVLAAPRCSMMWVVWCAHLYCVVVISKDTKPVVFFPRYLVSAAHAGAAGSCREHGGRLQKPLARRSRWAWSAKTLTTLLASV